MSNKNSIYRIAVIGPESTGKSTLCKGLAEHFNTVFAPEFSRDYTSNLEKNYTESDVLHCIAEQFNLEKSLLNKATKYLFSDTESIVGKVWLEDKFGPAPAWVEALISDYPYDLYLLTSNDIPFENDPVRENPLRRDFFFEWYQRELLGRKLNYKVISGLGTERLKNAVKIIEDNFK